MERGTEGMAARWNTHFAPSMAPRAAAGSAMEPSNSLNLGYCDSRAAFSRLPLEKSSSPVTSCPSRSSASVRCPPMNPAAPVTQIFATYNPPRSLAGGGTFIRRRHGEGNAARHAALRGVQLLAVTGVAVQELLAELLVLRPHVEDPLLIPRLLRTVRPRWIVGLAAADLVRELEAGVPAAGSQQDSEHAGEREQGAEASHGGPRSNTPPRRAGEKRGMRFVWLHGFASGPASSKGRFVRARLWQRGIELSLPDL